MDRPHSFRGTIDRVQGRLNRSIDDANNVLDAAKYAELSKGWRRENNSGTDRCNHRYCNHAPPVICVSEDQNTADHEEYTLAHCFLRSTQAALTAPETSSGSSGSPPILLERVSPIPDTYVIRAAPYAG